MSNAYGDHDTTDYMHPECCECSSCEDESKQKSAVRLRVAQGRVYSQYNPARCEFCEMPTQEGPVCNACQAWAGDEAKEYEALRAKEEAKGNLV